MSDTDPAEAPHGRDGGALTDPPPPPAGRPRPSRGGSRRDLPPPGDDPSGSKGSRRSPGQDGSAAPSAGGWPSVSEWRERRRRTADSPAPLAPQEHDESTAAGGATVHRAPGGVVASGQTLSGGGEASPHEAPADETSIAGPTPGQEALEADPTSAFEDTEPGDAPGSPRSSDGPGSDWRVAGGKAPEAGSDRGMGGFRAGGPSVDAEPPPEADGAPWWSPAPLLPSGEESGPQDAPTSRRGRRPGSRGGGKRGRATSRSGGRLPDGPDDDPTAAPDADPEAVARAICLRLLTMAPKTRAQLAQALRKRDVPEEAAQAVLDRFSELGLINDEAFAEAWVDSRHHGRGLAKRALAAELRHRGVDSETVNEAVERLDPDQELETARRLVERKLASTRTLDTQARTRRLAGMLARKGYAPGLAFRVVKEALEQEGLEIDDDYP